MLKHKLIALSAALPLALAVAASTGPAGAPAASGFQATPEQAAAARLVYGILSDSRYVYRSKPLNDELSAEIHRRYLESQFRELFELTGTPLRVEFRTSRNPYAD